MSVWVASSAVTLTEVEPSDVILAGLRRIESQDVRIRWRQDIPVGTVFRDDNGVLRHVERVQEAGRRKWLDMRLARYGYLTRLSADIPSDRTPDGFVPQSAAWDVTNNGAIVNVVRIASAVEDTSQGSLLGYIRFNVVCEPGDSHPPTRLNTIPRDEDTPIRVSLRPQGGGRYDGWLVYSSFTDRSDFAFAEDAVAYSGQPGQRGFTIPANTRLSFIPQTGDFIVIL